MPKACPPQRSNQERIDGWEARRLKEKTIDPEWIERIIRSLEGLEYGSVQIIVHDSRITQIERLEKFRYPLEKKTINGREVNQKAP